RPEYAGRRPRSERMSALELGGDELDLELTSLADQADAERAPDRVADHEPVKLVDALDRRLVDRDDQVFGAEARARRGAVLDDLHDLDTAVLTELPCEPRGQWTRTAREAEVRAAKPPLSHQRSDDPARRCVDRDREAEADARDGGVDPDDAAATVRERAAGVARIECGVRLDHVVDEPLVRSGPRRQRPPERGDDTRGHRAAEAVRVPDRDDELADAQALRV